LPEGGNSYALPPAPPAPWLLEQEATTHGSTSQPASSSTTALAPDVIAAIRRAFPDASQMPGELKQMIDKNDQQQSRQVTKEIHNATSQLGKHKKTLQDVCEARLKHRVAWCKYIQDCTDAWTKHLAAFEEQEASLKALETKTKQEIVTCSETIKALSNAQASYDDLSTKDAQRAEPIACECH